jgi:hypothetical protein
MAKFKIQYLDSTDYGVDNQLRTCFIETADRDYKSALQAIAASPDLSTKTIIGMYNITLEPHVAPASAIREQFAMYCQANSIPAIGNKFKFKRFTAQYWFLAGVRAAQVFFNQKVELPMIIEVEHQSGRNILERRLEARRRQRRLERKMNTQISNNDGAQSGASLPPRTGSVKERLMAYHRQLSPHQYVRTGPKLIAEAAAEIEALENRLAICYADASCIRADWLRQHGFPGVAGAVENIRKHSSPNN